jgi:hypothetical protein
VTFEDGIIVHAATGANAEFGKVTPVTASPLEGLYSAEVEGQSSYFEIAIPPQNDLYIAFYFRLMANPANTPRPLRFDDSRVSLQLGTGNRMRLLSGSGEKEGASEEIVVGETYRVGLHLRTGQGTASAEAWVSAGKTPFGEPFATFTGEAVDDITKLLLGSGADGMHAVYDDVRVDSARMP